VTRAPRIQLALGALALAAVLLAACGSGGGSSGSGGASSADASLRAAGTTVLGHISHYDSATKACMSASTPVVCLEAADRALGGQIHTYANLLAIGHGFTAPPSDLAAARNQAQTLANSLEILGDAQPTQANYDQVLNNFDVAGALTHLQDAVRKVSGELGA
jgi:hypothetical protein